MLHQQYTEFLIKEIGFLKVLITRIHEQETIADIELDLALSKIQGMYEQLLKLKLIHNQLAKADKGAYGQQTEKAVPETATILPPENNAPDFIPEPQPEIRPAPPAPAVFTEKVEPIPAIETKTVENVVPKRETTILADKIRPVGYNPINETLAQKKTSTDLAGKLQATPLDNISSGIGVNDKFLYIRELFHNDGNLFRETVKKIDEAGSLEEALDVVRPFNWNQDMDTVRKFVSLIHRKHTVH